MGNSRVTKFNIVCGKAPLGLYTDDKEEVWKQIKEQALRIYEEAKELLDAVEDEDMEQVLDGHLDTRFTNEYMEDLLSACSIDVGGAWEAVLDNNDSKYTTSMDVADASLVEHLKNGVDCHISTELFEGEVYYTIKRSIDNKVLKLVDHVSPDMGKYIPENWK